MKQTFLIFLYLISILPFTGCSEDEDGSDSNVTIENPMDLLEPTIPSSMSSSSDPYAQAANAMVISATSFATIGASFFAGVENATPTTSTLPGGVGSCSYYEYSANEATVAYQACEDDNNYYLDVYYQEGATLEQVLSLEQKKDGTSGSMELTSGISYLVSWNLVGDELTMSIKSDNVLVYELTSNQSTGSGSVVYYDETDSGAKQVFEWDANGSGSYTSYDSSGTVLESASWT
ncbi:hypothetical protein [Reichenbachiella sp.]|uniref:hypothetical protein n=1 Tax=Reichenbachiella sp. TaxID=2184521 RepID=UPI003BB001A8